MALPPLPPLSVGAEHNPPLTRIPELKVLNNIYLPIPPAAVMPPTRLHQYVPVHLQAGRITISQSPQPAMTAAEIYTRRESTKFGGAGLLMTICGTGEAGALPAV